MRHFGFALDTFSRLCRRKVRKKFACEFEGHYWDLEVLLENGCAEYSRASTMVRRLCIYKTIVCSEFTDAL